MLWVALGIDFSYRVRSLPQNLSNQDRNWERQVHSGAILMKKILRYFAAIIRKLLI